MAYKINALKRTESGTGDLELLDNSFETKELALEYLKDNLMISELSEEIDVVVLELNGEKYHYFEIITV
jgi:hypothetical protein